MLEFRLKRMLQKEEERRKERFEKGFYPDFYNDSFEPLTSYLIKACKATPFYKHNIKIISRNFDRILPFINKSNTDILFNNFRYLEEEPIFKEKFKKGLIKYPYKKDGFYDLFKALNDGAILYPHLFNNFVDNDIIRIIAATNMEKNSFSFYREMADCLYEDRQFDFIKILTENHRYVPFALISNESNVRQYLADNLSFFMENTPNLYGLRAALKEYPNEYTKVSEYIDTHPDKALDALVSSAKQKLESDSPVLSETIKLIISDVARNENVKLSEITYSNGGSYSTVLFIGDKVVKVGFEREQYVIPDNPFIIKPLLRRKIEIDDKEKSQAFVEVIERADTTEEISSEDLYQLFKNIRDYGLIWSDVSARNVGRLRKDNVIHWNGNLEPSNELLGIEGDRGDLILKKGDLVVLDADFIYREDDEMRRLPLSSKERFTNFEERYQSEKRMAISQESNSVTNTLSVDKADTKTKS